MALKEWEKEYLFPICLSWFFVAIDSCGLSRGLVALWNPLWVNVKAFKCFASLLLTSFIRGIPSQLHLLNLYARFCDKMGFGDKKEDSGMTNIRSMLIYDNLNVMVVSEES